MKTRHQIVFEVETERTHANFADLCHEYARALTQFDPMTRFFQCTIVGEVEGGAKMSAELARPPLPPGVEAFSPKAPT